MLNLRVSHSDSEPPPTNFSLRDRPSSLYYPPMESHPTLLLELFSINNQDETRHHRRSSSAVPTAATSGGNDDDDEGSAESDVVVIMNVALRVEGMSKREFHSLDPAARAKLIGGLVNENISANAEVEQSASHVAADTADVAAAAAPGNLREPSSEPSDNSRFNLITKSSASSEKNASSTQLQTLEVSRNADEELISADIDAAYEAALSTDSSASVNSEKEKIEVALEEIDASGTVHCAYSSSLLFFT